MSLTYAHSDIRRKEMADPGKKQDGDGKKQDDDGTYYISADQRVSFTPQEAVEKSLQFESSSGTGVGCNQSPENVVTPDK